MAAPASYPALVARLVAARRAGVRFELSRVRAALARLGSPERKVGVVLQVGGTNGKGSTAAFAESIARAAGLRAGLYTSPHLSRFAERFRVAGDELGEAELLEAGLAALAADPAGELTFFELATLMALCAFAARGTEVAVLEVGMGGRLDATTAAGASIAAVTGVALDHQAYLGETLAAIAGEKAGIFAAGQRAVIGAAGEPEAVPILVDAARAAGVASLTVIDGAAIGAVPGRLGLAGRHQARNAACALALIDALEAARGAPIDRAAREAGLVAARLPGRLESFEWRGRRVVVDGAHNPQAARVVAGELASIEGRVVVLAVSSDKDAAALAAPLCAGAEAVVVCETRSDRALPRTALAVAVAAGYRGPVVEAASVADALERAVAMTPESGAVIATGSLFLAGEVREVLLGETADEVPLSDPLVR